MINKFLAYTTVVDNFVINITPSFLLIVSLFELYANHQFTAFILTLAAVITHTQSTIHSQLVKINKFHDQLKIKANEILND